MGRHLSLRTGTGAARSTSSNMANKRGEDQSQRCDCAVPAHADVHGYAVPGLPSPHGRAGGVSRGSGSVRDAARHVRD